MEKYQSLPQQSGASDSYGKLAALCLPPLVGLRVLDVGCNEGFFSQVAYLGGAASVTGIDNNPEVIASAKKRFPNIKFIQGSWTENIEGTFDVILCLSAIHYAEDQPLLIQRLVDKLSSDGVLVLEQGIVAGDTLDYVPVRRAADELLYPTNAALDRILAPLGSYRVIGRSVMQSGDPVPRYVIHVRRWKRTVFFFDTGSYSGKSSAVRSLLGTGNAGQIISLDSLFGDVHLFQTEAHLKHRQIIDKIVAIKEKSEYANIIMEELGRGNYIELFSEFLVSLVEDDARVVLIDGFIPDASKFSVRSYFDKTGFITWICAPFRSLDPGLLPYGNAFIEIGGNKFFASADNIRIYVDDINFNGNDIRIIGWGLHVSRGSPLHSVRVFINHNEIGGTVTVRTSRPEANKETSTPEAILLGFEVSIPAQEVLTAFGGVEKLLLQGALFGRPSAPSQIIRVFATDGASGLTEGVYAEHLRNIR